jgi:hypothetical protein
MSERINRVLERPVVFFRAIENGPLPLTGGKEEARRSEVF